jgi:Kdo2-lipid IVA lauroyltransferase/acyltransferase
MPSPSATAPSLAHRAQHTLFTAALHATARLDAATADRFGAALGRFGYRPLGIRRRLVENQIRASFPDRDDAWVRRTARACFEHLGRETVALLRMSRLTPDEMVARTEVINLELGDVAVRGGRGVVVVAGHLGNWEMGAAMMAARGYPVSAVVARQRNPLFDDWIVSVRERMGVEVIERSRASREALRALRRGNIVAFVADQNAGPGGVFVPFFGRLASTHRGPALMAVRTGAPLLLAVPIRCGEDRYCMRLEAVDVDRAGELDDVVHRLTAAFTARLEAAIRATPEQYLWLHRRWKTRPPAEQQPAITV